MPAAPGRRSRVKGRSAEATNPTTESRRWTQAASGAPRDSVGPTVGLTVAGLGPAGMAIVAAARDAGVLDTLTRRGLCLIDPAPDRGGGGSLGAYSVRSDTAGRVFTECAASALSAGGLTPESPVFGLLHACDRDGPVRLSVAADLLTAAAAPTIAGLAAAAPHSVVTGRVDAIEPGHEACIVNVATAAGTRVVRTRALVLATGGSPYIPSVVGRRAGSVGVVHSDAVIRGQTPPAYQRAVSIGRPRIVIIGGSHSAFSAAKVLLDHDPARRWPPGTITIVHRSPVRITYPDRAAALADRCRFNSDDVCSHTGRVFRFGGLRADSADLWRKVRDGIETRIGMVRCGPGDPIAGEPMKSADLVIAATGYAETASGLLTRWRAPADPTRRCRFDTEAALRDRHGEVVPGVFGIGLGAGRRRDDSTGGERSFAGNIDGVWFYQRVVAPTLLERLGAI